MLALGSFAFAAPWLLAALAGLPVIWWLLRVTPPAPRRIPFPAVRLLLGLVPREETPARTPLWLILLRTLLAAIVIVAVAHPLLNPQPRLPSRGPIVLVLDDGWAAARDWPQRQHAANGLLVQAEREQRQIVLVTTAPPEALPLQPVRAADARAAVEALQPKPWPVDRALALKRLEALAPAQGTLSVWISDGIDDDANATAALAGYLDARGRLRYLSAAAKEAPLLLAPGDVAAGDLTVTVETLPVALPRPVELRTSAENGALLTQRAATIGAGASRIEVSLPMPTELRNRAIRIDIAGERAAAGALLIDERWRRRPVGIAAPPSAVGQSLLSDTYYLEKALNPFTEVRRGTAAELLRRDLAVLVLPDAGPDSTAEAQAIEAWVTRGGLLLRFAGPRLAAGGDTLLPVRLRRGGRTIGGALSWERPASLAPFPPESPFAGLTIPDDVTVARQVLAEPDLDLAGKVWARLADGTPLVTGVKRGKGWLVLVHTTANADWSNLALSGLFVQMLRRVVALSQGVAAASEGPLPPLETLDGFGRLERAPATAHPLAGKDLATAAASPRHPPGFYGTTDARRALNLANGIAPLRPIDGLPADTLRQGFANDREVDLRPPLYAAALILLLLDLLIAYGLRGLLWRRPARAAAAALIALLVVLPIAARADDGFALRATAKFHLAYVRTGNEEVDAESAAGLAGLSAVLNQRTAVEAAEPMAIDIEHDPLIFFPLLYWPVTADEPVPSPQAAERVNRYLDTGGTILFDMREGGDDAPGPFGGPALASQRLQRLVGGIKMPPLEPIPPNHVLSKSFYLLHDYPGRWDAGSLWVEPADDHVNDGVSTAIVGANDWAGAWAIDADGHPLFAVVPGGERQREMALRFGVNLVMYVLTGNYKSDQVHVPAILERLGE